MDTNGLRQEMDTWVKDLRSEIVSVKDDIDGEHAENINHNYELIKEMKEEIYQLRQKIGNLEAMQLISLKSRSLKDISYPEMQK